MKIDFKTLVTSADWEGALTAIVEFTRSAVLAGDEAGMEESAQRLNQFIDASPPDKPWATDLDDHAREALAQLALDRAGATNADLQSRTEELRRIGKAIAATAVGNRQIAASLRHEKLTRALVASLDTAQAVRELQVAVQDEAGDKTLSAAAGKLLDALAQFKTVMAAADGGQ